MQDQQNSDFSYELYYCLQCCKMSFLTLHISQGERHKIVSTFGLIDARTIYYTRVSQQCLGQARKSGRTTRNFKRNAIHIFKVYIF